MQLPIPVYLVRRRDFHRYPEARSWCRFHRRSKPTTSTIEYQHPEARRLRKIGVPTSPLRTAFQDISNRSGTSDGPLRSIIDRMLELLRSVSAQSSKLLKNFIALMQICHGQ